MGGNDNEDLVIERVKRWTEKLTPEERKKPSLFCMSGEIYTPDQVIEEIKKDSPIGKTFRKAEELLLKRTLEKKRAAGL